MFFFNQTACYGAALALGAGSCGFAFAGESASSYAPFSLLPTAPLYADANAAGTGTEAPPTPEHQPLMALLSKTPVGKAMDNARINLYGWLEGSYEYNATAPTGNRNFGRSFDFFQSNRGYLNQADVTLERTVDLRGGKFDVGGRADVFYGSDARFTNSYGFLDHETGEYHLDVPQAYLDFVVPLGHGLQIRAGKFDEFKQIDPNANTFYTHTFPYFRALPFTLTGISATYACTDKLTIEGGIARGWNVSLKDNNGAIDAFSRITLDLTDTSRLKVNLISGPELPSDNSHYTTVVDVTYVQDLTEKLSLLFDFNYGYQARPSGSLPGFPPPNSPAFVSHNNANWYGVSGNAIYKINDLLSVAGRAGMVPGRRRLPHARRRCGPEPL